MIKRFIRSIPVGLSSAIMVLVICYFSLTEKPIGDSDFLYFENADKVAHFLMYLIATMVFIADAVKLRYPHTCKLSLKLAIMMASATLGVLMEVGQLLIKLGRVYDHRDILANCAGAVLGFLIMHFCGGSKAVRRILSTHHHHRRHHHHHHHHHRSDSSETDE